MLCFECCIVLPRTHHRKSVLRGENYMDLLMEAEMTYERSRNREKQDYN